uniref:C3H1-type domain-containing protein n=1 Tax=Echinostoma caproni TaxID=27848 RepID=A0A183B5C7_9TREM
LFEWPSTRSNDLKLASQLVLLFMPPYLYARFRVLTEALQRVLSNHYNLANMFPCAPMRSMANANGTFERMLDAVVKSAATAFFGQSDQVSVGLPFSSPGENWRESLVRLLLCDSTGSMFHVPANLVRQHSSEEYLKHSVRSPYDTSLACDDPTTIQLSLGRNTVSRGDVDLYGVLNIPLCLVSVASASENRRVRAWPSSGALIDKTHRIMTKTRLASTPMLARDPLLLSPYRSYSTECFITEFGPNCDTDASCNRAHSTQLPHPGSLNMTSMTGHWGTSSCNSITSDTLTSLDPQRLASLGNTAHLIKLLNQIINDRQMDPRRKMKRLYDVSISEFRDQQTSSAYLERLQRRIDAQAQPTVLERITNVLRRGRQSRSRVRPQCSASESPPRSTAV